MVPRGEWDFDKDLIILQDPGEMERVHAAMRFRHDRLSSFQMVHHHLQIPGAPTTTIEEKFIWFVEECKKDGPLPHRGCSSKSPGDNRRESRAPTQAKVRSASVTSPHRQDCRISNTGSQKLFSPTHVFKVPNSRGSRDKDPNTIASNSIKKKNYEDHERRPFKHLSDGEINVQLETLQKTLADLQKQQATSMGKKRHPSPISSSDESDAKEDHHACKKGKGKFKEKKKNSSRREKKKKKKYSSDSSDESPARHERGDRREKKKKKKYSSDSSDESPSRHEHGHRDRRRVLKFKHRIPVKSDRKAMYSRIRTMCAVIYPGWVHWSKQKKDTKKLLRFHEEVRGAFKNGDVIDTIWLEKKVGAYLRNQRFDDKCAVKDLFDVKSQQYVQPEGMDEEMFKDIVRELIADLEDKLGKRAHQGDKGSAGLRRIVVRTTNPWGQGGEDMFHGRFQSKYGRKAEKWERDFAKEWTYKELVCKLSADAKEEWIPLASSKSKTEKDAAWLAKHQPEQAPLRETRTQQEARLAAVRRVVPESQQERFHKHYPEVDATQAATIVRDLVEDPRQKLPLSDSASLSENNSTDCGSASESDHWSDPGTESSSPAHNSLSGEDDTHEHITVPSINRLRRQGFSEFRRPIGLSEDISGADGGDRPHSDVVERHIEQTNINQRSATKVGSQGEARPSETRDAPPVQEDNVANGMQNQRYVRSEPIRTRHQKPLNSYKSARNKK